MQALQFRTERYRRRGLRNAGPFILLSGPALPASVGPANAASTRRSDSYERTQHIIENKQSAFSERARTQQVFENKRVNSSYPSIFMTNKHFRGSAGSQKVVEFVPTRSQLGRPGQWIGRLGAKRGGGSMPPQDGGVNPPPRVKLTRPPERIVMLAGSPERRFQSGLAAGASIGSAVRPGANLDALEARQVGRNRPFCGNWGYPPWGG
jgi:hypothetical protein